jgi:hypothetical protein
VSRPKPTPGVEYAADGPGGFLAHSRGAAVRSLADWLGVETRNAARMLADGTAAAEVRSRNGIPGDPAFYGIGPLTGPQARRVLERRYRQP